MRERNGSSETGKYLDRNQEAAEKTALSGGYDLLSHPPIFTFKIENESIVVCEPKSKDVEEDIRKKRRADHEANKMQRATQVTRRCYDGNFDSLQIKNRKKSINYRPVEKKN